MFKLNKNLLLVSSLSSLFFLTACSTVEPSKNHARFTTDVYDVVIVSKTSLDKSEFDKQVKKAIYEVDTVSEESLKDSLKTVGTVTLKQRYWLIPSDDNAVSSTSVSNMYQTTDPRIKNVKKGDNDLFASISLTQSSDSDRLYMKSNLRQGNNSKYIKSQAVIEKGKAYSLGSYAVGENTYNLQIISANLDI